jgi:septal ring factor EnvC (AmiA/AmiB activator)
MEAAYVVEIHEKIAELEARLKMAETEKQKLNNQMGMLSRENEILMKALDKLYAKEQELGQALTKILLLEKKLMLMAGKG